MSWLCCPGPQLVILVGVHVDGADGLFVRLCVSVLRWQFAKLTVDVYVEDVLKILLIALL